MWAPYVCEYASKRNRETNLFEFLELYDFQQKIIQDLTQDALNMNNMVIRLTCDVYQILDKHYHCISKLENRDHSYNMVNMSLSHYYDKFFLVLDLTSGLQDEEPCIKQFIKELPKKIWQNYLNCSFNKINKLNRKLDPNTIFSLKCILKLIKAN